MATLAQEPISSATGDERFFLKFAIAMAVIVVVGFSTQLAMGRSTFASPVRVHIHAVLFMGWVAIYVTQNILVATDRVHLHRKLGWLAAAWMVAMVVSGVVVTLAMVRNGVVPFFFRPLQFLVFDPVAVLTFAGLTTAAILLRKQTEWHRRLHFCGMAILLAPAFGRLLPMPLLKPWSYEVAFVGALILPLTAVAIDARRKGFVHPAWIWGIGVSIGSIVLTEAITYSPIGLAIYESVTAGYPGEAIAPLDFPPPPEGPLMTGRAN